MNKPRITQDWNKLADKQITGLPEYTALTNNDLLVGVDVGQTRTVKIPISALRSALVDVLISRLDSLESRVMLLENP